MALFSLLVWFCSSILPGIPFENFWLTLPGIIPGTSFGIFPRIAPGTFPGIFSTISFPLSGIFLRITSDIPTGIHQAIPRGILNGIPETPAEFLRTQPGIVPGDSFQVFLPKIRIRFSFGFFFRSFSRNYLKKFSRNSSKVFSQNSQIGFFPKFSRTVSWIF